VEDIYIGSGREIEGFSGFREKIENNDKKSRRRRVGEGLRG